jgi:hypothetical protein
MKAPAPGHSKEEEKLREAFNKDPGAFGVTGWYKRGLGGDRMKALAAEIKGREAERIKNNPKIGKEDQEMSVSWTPDRKEKYMATIAAKSKARLAAIALVDPETAKRKEVKNKADRERRLNNKKKLAGNGEPPSVHLKELPGNGAPLPAHLEEAKACLSIYCMRCGFPMQIEDPGSFVSKK